MGVTVDGDITIGEYWILDDEDWFITAGGSLTIGEYLETDDGDITIDVGGDLRVGDYLDSYYRLEISASNIYVESYISADDEMDLYAPGGEIYIGDYLSAYEGLTAVAESFTVEGYLDTGSTESTVTVSGDINVGDYWIQDDEDLNISAGGNLNVTGYLETDDGDLNLSVSGNIIIGDSLESYLALNINTTNLFVGTYVGSGDDESHVNVSGDITVAEYWEQDDEDLYIVAGGDITIGEYFESDDGRLIVTARDLTVGEYLEGYYGLNVSLSGNLNVTEYVESGDGESRVNIAGNVYVGEYWEQDDEDLFMTVGGNINITEYFESDVGLLSVTAQDLTVGEYFEGYYGIMASLTNLNVGEYVVSGDGVSRVDVEGDIMVAQYWEQYEGSLSISAGGNFQLGENLLGDDITITAGSVTVGGNVTVTLSLFITSDGDLSIGTLDIGNGTLSLVAAGDLQFGDLTNVVNITLQTGSGILDLTDVPVIYEESGDLILSSTQTTLSGSLLRNGTIELGGTTVFEPQSVNITTNDGDISLAGNLVIGNAGSSRTLQVSTTGGVLNINSFQLEVE